MIGGGGQLCITKKGVGVCGELGFGGGGSLDVSPFEDLPKDEISAEATFKAGIWGVGSLNFGIKGSAPLMGGCATWSPTLKGGIGPLEVDATKLDWSDPHISTLLDKAKYKTKWNDIPGRNFNPIKNIANSVKPGIRFEAAFKSKACSSYRW